MLKLKIRKQKHSRKQKRKSKKLRGGSIPPIELLRGGIYEATNIIDRIKGVPLGNSPYPSDQPALLA
jgi:hypothetical protein